MLTGFREGQDILNLSLGDIDGWSEATLSVVASRIAARGTIVVTAAGNGVSPSISYVTSATPLITKIIG